jgi:hypothetical protein
MWDALCKLPRDDSDADTSRMENQRELVPLLVTRGA